VNPSYSDSFTVGTPAVQVVISKPYPKYFGGVFGGGTVTVTTTAVAHMVATDDGCIFQLDPASSANMQGMNFNGPSCGIMVNGTANLTNATMNAQSIGYAGSPPSTTGAVFSGATPAPALPATDPCPDIAGCNYLANHTPSTSQCTSGSYSGQVVTLQPGCYGTMNLSKATVTLAPGLYTINGSWNVNQATLTGTGVTLYGTSSGCVNFNKATVALTPPTTGDTANMLIYQSPATSSSGCTANFNSASAVSGVIYYPSIDSVNFNGFLGNYTVLITGGVNFNGSTETAPSPPAGGPPITMARLAE
jgi:hypothetical protein